MRASELQLRWEDGGSGGRWVMFGGRRPESCTERLRCMLPPRCMCRDGGGRGGAGAWLSSAVEEDWCCEDLVEDEEEEEVLLVLPVDTRW